MCNLLSLLLSLRSFSDDLNQFQSVFFDFPYFEIKGRIRSGLSLRRQMIQQFYYIAADRIVVFGLDLRVDQIV